MLPAWQCCMCDWINYLLGLVFQLSWWLMCFGYRTYSKSVKSILKRLFLNLRLRKTDWKLNIHYGTVNQGTLGGRKRGKKRNSIINLQCIYQACQLQRETWYCSCLDLYSTHWIILLQEWIIYINVHVCSFFSFKADAAPAVWRTSEVFWWNWKHWIEGKSFDRTGGGKRASWLQGRDRDVKTGDSFLYKHRNVPYRREDVKQFVASHL